jgi:DNA-binding NarL/FixJ family response regulator
MLHTFTSACMCVKARQSNKDKSGNEDIVRVIDKLYDEGKSGNAIAKELFVSKGTV